MKKSRSNLALFLLFKKSELYLLPRDIVIWYNIYMKPKIKIEVVSLRKKGKTYGEILKMINSQVAKSTISNWCRNIMLTPVQKERINNNVKKNLIKARLLSLSTNRLKRKKYLNSVKDRVKYLKNYIKNKDVAKITLAMLYLGEGSKNPDRGSLCFANSDPFVIYLFLSLMRKCYSINESKFRCTIQCRADQNVQKLENFWAEATKIPKSQFYRTRIDPRTIDKKSKKLDYKGVCRIDYFSADLFLELTQIPKIIHRGP